MDTAYKTTLELDKVLARAVQLCTCRETKALMQDLQPFDTVEEERYALAQTNAVNTLLLKNGSPRFGAVSGGKRIAAHAVKGGILSMGELLELAAALRNFDGLQKWYGMTDHEMLPTDDLFFALSPQPVLERQINSSSVNTTRFAIITRQERLSGDRFGLFFTVTNDAGCLARAVDIISEHGFNMHCLRSRAMKNLPWEYYFYAELDGNLADPAAQTMLQKLGTVCGSLRTLGCYTRVE